MNVGKIGIVLTGIYFAFGFYFLSFVDGRSAIDSWYLLSASLTTVSKAYVTLFLRMLACRVYFNPLTYAFGAAGWSWRPFPFTTEL